MVNVIFRLAIVSLGAFVGYRIFNTKEIKITSESNSSDEFKIFNERLEISKDKVNNLRSAHNTIRNKIKEYISTETNLPEPEFFIQGSYKTKTLVQNTNELCDVDLGVFFPRKPTYQVRTIQNYLKRALADHTSKGVVVLSNCVRVNYVRGFHVDLPIYFFENGLTYFGSRNRGWETSDPKEFIGWFKGMVSEKPQIVRLIRYLKAWLENVKSKYQRKLPSGLALSLWVIEFYEPDSRDDVAFFKTSQSILDYFERSDSWEARMPVEPRDNVINRLYISQKSFFYDKFCQMNEIARKAISSKTKEDAIKYWIQIFGTKFDQP